MIPVELTVSLTAQKELRRTSVGDVFTHGGTDWLIEEDNLDNQIIREKIGSEQGWISGVVASRINSGIPDDQKFILLFSNVLKFPGFRPKIIKTMVQHLIVSVNRKNGNKVSSVLEKESKSLFDNSILETLAIGKGV